MKSYIKALSIGLSLLGLSGMRAEAQGLDHAFRMSQESPFGTARSLSMGGAFGALGGDFSAVRQNPAGLGIYQSSDIQASFHFLSQNASALWYTHSTEKESDFKMYPSVSMVLSFYDEESDTSVGWAFGATPRHVFNRSYRAISGGKTPYSLADYTAYITSPAFSEDNLEQKGTYNPYNSTSAPWLSILGYNAGWLLRQPVGDKEQYASYFQYNGQIEGPNNSELDVVEKGSAYDYDFSFGTSFRDVVYFGWGARVATIDYRMASMYSEIFDKEDYLTLGNILETKGVGGSLNLGVIFRPSDMFRLGLSYFSPTWYSLTDKYFAQASSYKVIDDKGQIIPEKNRLITAETPEGATDYNLRTPSKWVASAALILGKYGLISSDLEWVRYPITKLSDQNGDYQKAYKQTKEYSQSAPTLRVGGELRLTPELSLRAGYMKRFSVWTNGIQPQDGALPQVELSEVGTVPHYELSGSLQAISGGVGFRSSNGFYADLAVVLTQNNSHVYAFPKRSYTDGTALGVEPISLSHRGVNTTLTIGYRF